MPNDSRRFNGPEDSINPAFYSEEMKQANTNDSEREIPQKRFDGRESDQFRPIFLKTDVISQTQGSAYIEMNETKIICAVYGPREVIRREDFSLKGQLTCDFKFTTFSCKDRRQHQQDSQEKDLSVQVLEAVEPAICLHKYPKSQINIYISVLQNDGSALCGAIICSSLALVTAGIEMYDTVVSASVAVVDSRVLVDPTEQEEDIILNQLSKSKINTASITVAFMPCLNQVSAITSDGELEFPMLKKGIKSCVDSCRKIKPLLHQTIVQYLHDKRESKS